MLNRLTKSVNNSKKYLLAHWVAVQTVPFHQGQNSEHHGPYDTEVGCAIDGGFYHEQPAAASPVRNV